MAEIVIHRKNSEFAFVATDEAGIEVRMDNAPDSGGTGFGARPMQLLLMGLGGCSGIDIVMILKKQRQDLQDFAIRISGNRQAGAEPSLWENVHMVFELTGKIDPDKAERACRLSMEKYCSVAETLRRGGTELTWAVNVHPQPS